MKEAISQYSSQVLVVGDFQTMMETEFQGCQNAICLERDVEGDFEEIVRKLTLVEPITEISEDDLLKLKLSDQGQIARNQILQDLHLLSESGNQPMLNLLSHYERDDSLDFISTDVYSYHVDRSPVGTDTILCTYYGAASAILPNDQANQKILIPEVRDQLRIIYDGPDEGFEIFLEENYFNLHYAALPDAQPIYMKNGQLWRIAVDSPDLPVPPCVHRAPEEKDQLRLLLIC